ncbi:MAG: hypothetical protein IT299_07870 [Dehalococcoidia bacterium]|nr:hypothetical protein [Dehalococcoidia bacterium]
MAYTVTIPLPGFAAGYSPGSTLGAPSEALTLDGGVAAAAVGVGVTSAAPTEAPPLRRLKRMVAYGPRCPDCAGPLVFGEGCQLCPVCGYSGCGPHR